MSRLPRCRRCGGHGSVLKEDLGAGGAQMQKCYRCKGTGREIGPCSKPPPEMPEPPEKPAKVFRDHLGRPLDARGFPIFPPKEE